MNTTVQRTTPAGVVYQGEDLRLGGGAFVAVNRAAGEIYTGLTRVCGHAFFIPFVERGERGYTARALRDLEWARHMAALPCDECQA